jgi:Na+-translocating ferredoxin:NAD+ oxidoreductase subunit B
MPEEAKMTAQVYKTLAERLDSLPNGFPPTPDGIELRLLARIFNPEEAYFASNLRITLETSEQISERMGHDNDHTYNVLKSMARKGLINAGRMDEGLGFGLLPFVVGIYEMQMNTMDEELALLFDAYYKQVFASMMEIQPTFHRVIPVNQSVRMDMEIKPYENAAEIVSKASAWGVLDCVCRKQQMLVGNPCAHPIDVCMALSKTPGDFDRSTTIRALSLEEALGTLERASRAGLVHTVSNSQEVISYICNCCTCSCGILRGMVELGLANVVARSAFVNRVNEETCIACEDCLDYCQFSALTINGTAVVNQTRCVGCGVCVPKCPEGALQLIRRPIGEILPPPVTYGEWQIKRADARGLDLNSIL